MGEIRRKMGLAEVTFCRSKKRHGGLRVPKVRRLYQLEEENRRLKQPVADLTPDKAMLRDAVRART